MTRAAAPTLSEPTYSRLLADFTNGSIPAGQIALAGSAGSYATGAAITYDDRGIGLSYGAETLTTKYVAGKWEPGGGNTIDLSGSDFIGFEIEFPEGGGNVFAAIGCFITTESGSTYTHYKNRTFLSGADKTPHRQIFPVRFSDSWTLGGGGPTNMAAIAKIEWRMTPHASLTGVPAQCWIRKLYLGQNKTNLILTFDDAMLAQYNYVFPSLAAHGIKGTLCPSPIHIGKDATRMTLAMIEEMYNAGWDIGIQQYNDSADIPVNYAAQTGLTSDGAGTATFANLSGVPHLKNVGDIVEMRGAANPAYNGRKTILTTADDNHFTFAISGTPQTPDVGWPTCERLSLNAAQAAWSDALEYFRVRGLTRGNHFAAYSNGVTDEWVESWMPGLGFTLARTTRVNADPFIGFDPRCMDMKARMRLPGLLMDQVTSTTMITNTNKLIARGASAIPYVHNVAPGAASLTMTEANWDATIAYWVRMRDAGSLSLVTASEFEKKRAVARAIPAA